MNLNLGTRHYILVNVNLHYVLVIVNLHRNIIQHYMLVLNKISFYLSTIKFIDIGPSTGEMSTPGQQMSENWMGDGFMSM